jgi:hypothetical protein
LDLLPTGSGGEPGNNRKSGELHDDHDEPELD